MRQRRVDAVRDAMTSGRYIEIRGEAGVGKSGVLRRLAEDLNTEAQVLVLSPNRVIERGWLSMKSAIGYDGSGRDLMNELSLSGAAIVFIDNLDFFRARNKQRSEILFDSQPRLRTSGSLQRPAWSSQRQNRTGFPTTC